MRFSICIIAACALFSVFCPENSMAKCVKTKVKNEVVQTTQNIPFQLANNYFIQNSIKTITSPKITTQNEFDQIFGAAAVMGRNGRPTPIDFKKQYVIVAAKPESDHSIEMKAIGLHQNSAGELVFEYQTTVGAKQSYTIHPFLLIVVDKKYIGKVQLKEVVK
jgi:hypothetical protein